MLHVVQMLEHFSDHDACITLMRICQVRLVRADVNADVKAVQWIPQMWTHDINMDELALRKDEEDVHHKG